MDIKYLRSEELEAGMIVANDVLNKNLDIILNEGFELTAEVIDKVKYSYSELKIPVYGEKSDYFSRKRIKKVEKFIEEMTDRLESAMKKLEVDESTSIKEIENMSYQILDEMKDFKVVFETIANSSNVDAKMYRHSVNVSIIASMIGKWMKMGESSILEISKSAILHDIGKTRLPEELLHKREYTKEERFLVNKHPLLGYEILKNISTLSKEVKDGVLTHHERNDGSGFPQGIKADKIPLIGKIVAIAEAFDNKVYGMKESPVKALEELQRDLFLGKFDPKCAMAFIRNMAIYYEGEDVVLNTGEVATIIKMNYDELGRPLVRVGEDFYDLSRKRDIVIEKLA